MAFVFKAEKNPQVEDKGPTELGPGEYAGPQVYKIKKAFAPFNSTSVRQQRQKPKFVTPGPGSYQVQRDSTQEKVLVSSLNQEIKIIEVPKQNGIFKSGTVRFDSNKEAEKVPGPGQYKVEGDMAKPINPNLHINGVGQDKASSKQVLQMLKGQKGSNSQLIIPSVPSKVHAFGYSEMDNNKLELNNNPFMQQDNRQIGPGQYQYKDTFENNKNKGAAWGRGKSKRKVNQIQSATNNNVGPGTYDFNADTNVQIHKCKPSSQFLSKSARLFDQQQGKLTQKVINKKLQNQASLMGDEEFAVQEQEYEPNSVPGPGSYFPKNSSTLRVESKPEKYQIFGTGSVRFPEKNKNSSTQNIGPGTYDQKKSLIQGKSFNQQSVPFMAMDSRFQKPLLQENPGPGQYNPKTNLEDQMINKLQKGYKGKFGYQEGRFVDNVEEEDQPGPGTYIDPNQYVDNLQRNFDKKTHNFRSQSTRQVFSCSKFATPPVGNYQLDYYNLNRKMQKIKEEEAELEIKRPGFYSSQPRFDPLKKEMADPDDADDDQLFEKNFSNGKTTQDVLYQKNLKKKVPFNSNQNRFSYKDIERQADKPGPGSYNDQQAEQWNKRTYNILFADI